MPRGSKPGERRGGRQRATPNKKTALTNAALALDHAEVVPCPMLLGSYPPPNSCTPLIAFQRILERVVRAFA
jgi:hypothetical protein